MSPNEVDRLTVRDFDLLATQIEAENAAIEQAAKAQKTSQRQARARRR